MGAIYDAFAQAFRDFATSGVPGSGAHEVEKSEARYIGLIIEQVIGLLTTGVKSYATAADLPTSPVPIGGTQARVYSDPDPDKNVFWVYKGGWVIDTDLMTAITVQLSAANTWTGVQSYSQDVLLGSARVGRDGNNLRFGYGAVRPAATGQTNVGIGDDALGSLTTGNRNVALGSNSGQAITTGQFNVLAGYAGLALTAGQFNVFIGADAGSATTVTSNNIAIGYSTMLAATGCNEAIALGSSALGKAQGLLAPVAIGSGALSEVTTGVGNNGLGHNALGHTTTGQFNVAFGAEALVANVTGNYNAAFGCYALDGNVGSRNTGIGYATAYLQASGNDNTYVGFTAGRGGASGEGTDHDTSRNTGIGSETLRRAIATGADDNTAVGFRAGYNIETGKDNSLFGSGAGSNLTTGQRNIVIGKDRQADSPADNDQINIGDRLYHDRTRLKHRGDPAKPAAGESITWVSDGTGFGAAGDLCFAATVGATTRRTILAPYASGAVW